MGTIPDTPPNVRLVLAVSIDGRLAPPEGGPATLGDGADRQALEEALAWADAVLIGAGTLRTHGTTCLIHRRPLLEQRRCACRDDQPVAMVVSRSGRLPGELAFFRQPLRRWWLDRHEGDRMSDLASRFPSEEEPTAKGCRTDWFERRLPFSPWSHTIAQLASLGQRRLVVLGGAQLAATLLSADVVDALQLTICPLLLGGRHLWLPLDAVSRERWRLEEARSLGHGELLVRYRRERGSS